MSLMKNKRGSPTDLPYFLVIIFFLAVSFVFVLFTNDKLQTIISTTVLNSSAAYESINDSFTYINTFAVNRAFVLFFTILCIGILVSSFLVRVHPIFIFIYIITLGVTIFISIYLANAYSMIVANAQLASLASNYSMITFIMRNVAKILLGIAGISFIILFGKIGGGGSDSVDL